MCNEQQENDDLSWWQQQDQDEQWLWEQLNKATKNGSEIMKELTTNSMEDGK